MAVWSVAAFLLLLSGDVETNPGPKKGAPKEPAGPTPEQRITELETKVKTYEEQIGSLEKTLESQKEDSQKKLETLESQMTQVTTDLAKMREKEEAEDLGTKLNQLNEELDAKISDAESKLQLLNSSFEQFQTLTNDNQSTSQQKIEEVESQINSFKSHSEGTVQDVMGDTENLKDNYSTLEQRVKDIKVEAQGKIQALASATKEQRREYKSKFVDLDVEFARMRERLETMNMILDDIQEKMYEFEQSKKNNLILYGITTRHPETTESLRSRVSTIFRDNLNIKRDLPVLRATRVRTGPEVRGCRPVLVTFETFKDRETVLRLAKVLKKANVIVTEDLSKRTRESRQELRKFMRQIKKANPERACFLEYDKLYVENKIYVFNEALCQVIEQAEAERMGYGHDMSFSRPGTQLGGFGMMGGGYGHSRPASGMSGIMGPPAIHPKSASSIPRLPPLARAVSLATGMAQLDPREEKMNEMERIIQSYQEKLDSVTSNYQEKVNILERKLVDKDIVGNGLMHGGDMSDIEVDRDEDGQSPLPHHIQYNGLNDPYFEVPSNNLGPPQAPPTTNVTFNTTPGSPQKKLVQPMMETLKESEETGAAEVDSNTSGDR